MTCHHLYVPGMEEDGLKYCLLCRQWVNEPKLWPVEATKKLSFPDISKIGPFILPAIAFFLVCFLVFRWVTVAKIEPRITPCEEFRNEAMRYVPARCFKYWSEKQ